jgi:hypothetical protein
MTPYGTIPLRELDQRGGEALREGDRFARLWASCASKVECERFESGEEIIRRIRPLPRLL